MEPTYVQILKEEYHKRKTKNPFYSIRAFSRDMDINPGTFSAIIAGTRVISEASADKLVKGLSLASAKRIEFLNSVKLSKINFTTLKNTNSEESYHVLEETDYQNEIMQNLVIHWQYYAILNLLELSQYKYSERGFTDIAQRLSLPLEQVSDIIDQLIEIKMVSLGAEGLMQRTQSPLYTKNDISSETIKMAHKNRLDLTEKMLSQSIQKREFQSFTFKSNQKKLRISKKLLREFLNKFIAVSEDDKEIPNEDVFQINVQLYSLT